MWITLYKIVRFIKSYPLPLYQKVKHEYSMLSKIENKFYKNKSAKVGEMCICPSCGGFLVKQNIEHIFCRTKCEDFYKTNVIPSKFDFKKII